MTVVANEFIDHKMAKANGEYVKVYLYLLRHADEEKRTGEIADALELTERDVKRALAYWQREGVLEEVPGGSGPAPGRRQEEALPGAEPEMSGSSFALPAESGSFSGEPENAAADEFTGGTAQTSPDRTPQASPDRAALPGTARGTLIMPEDPVPDRSGVDVFRLREDEAFINLLYVVQRYLSRIFSQTDNETIAYLYDVLKMPVELIEYLAEMCAERGKTSLRYLESVALDWHRKGIRTVEQAQAEAELYTAEVYGVMKAFGLNGRNPAAAELKYIRKWFGTYGFQKEIVLEAVNRTISATQKPSFQYADKILTEWHDAGVKTRADIVKRDEAHGARPKPAAKGNSAPEKRQSTRFVNFEQRDDDLDGFAMDRMLKKMNS